MRKCYAIPTFHLLVTHKKLYWSVDFLIQKDAGTDTELVLSL